MLAMRLTRLLPLLSLLAAALPWTLELDASRSTEEFEFANGTIDLGIVVRDLERSAAFYGEEGLGLSAKRPFSVPGEFCSKAGLTDGSGLDIKVFRPSAATPGTHTGVKLMQAPKEAAASKNGTILEELGFSYLTIYVTHLDPILERLAKKGVKPLAEGPTPLPGQGPDGTLLALVPDPDGNLIELIGPR
jgi:catechol 2,3-dioxygenase-like lactoylglutathione lyase family enzyme